MALTPETVARHELNGLPVEVVDADSPDLVGIAGRVVTETMRTLRVESDAPRAGRGRDDETTSRVRQVPKQGTTFQFRLPRTDEAAGARKGPGSASELASETAGETGQSGACEGAVYVTVDGARLLSRPARRTENAGDSQWR